MRTKKEEIRIYALKYCMVASGITAADIPEVNLTGISTNMPKVKLP
ncbi:MAG: hypothetical protein ISS59_08575 [Desulfobacteraceae bacterium]|nr:hypothetical protein [Desulfobacteraceae bacterium]